MDYFYTCFMLSHYSRVKKGIQNLSKRSSKTLQTFFLKCTFPIRFVSFDFIKYNIDKFIPIFLLMISILLGHWAFETSKSETLKFWEKSRPPSRNVWKHYLNSQGYKEIEFSKTTVGVVKTLPVTIDNQGGVFSDQELTWIILFLNPESNMPYVLFTENPKIAVNAWEFFGYGWSAFDKVAEKMETLKNKMKKNIPKIKAPTFSDPFEIVY